MKPIPYMSVYKGMRNKHINVWGSLVCLNADGKAIPN
jgi:hypothetical protein